MQSVNQKQQNRNIDENYLFKNPFKTKENIDFKNPPKRKENIDFKNPPKRKENIASREQQ